MSTYTRYASAEKWKVTFLVSRQKDQGSRQFQSFELDVDPDEYVLDGIERIWAFHDRSLTFRHACHHSTCGACGMLVNNVEKLTCITPIRSVTSNGGTIKVEPLRNFPVVSDLVVDMSYFYANLEETHFNQVAPLEDACLPYEKKAQKILTTETRRHEEGHGEIASKILTTDTDTHTQGTHSRAPAENELERLVDCIECGMCVSACPSALTSTTYYGPAILAAAQHGYAQSGDVELIHLADGHDGAWGCHSAYECSAVCPSNVDPAWRIMDLRKQTIAHRLRHVFEKKESPLAPLEKRGVKEPKSHA